jgi:hypothetical protein
MREASASMLVLETTTTATDDEEERRGRLLLLGKGAVLAHRFDRPLAAESDEDRQRDSVSTWSAGAPSPLVRSDSATGARWGYRSCPAEAVA